MARIGCLLFVLIIAIVGYDQYKIQQLENRVSAISGKVQGNKSEGASDLVTALAQAQKHVAKAKALIAQKKTVQAQAELDKVLVNLKSANTVSKDIVGSVADTLGKARDNAINVFQKAWSDISEQARPSKIDVTKD